MWSKEESERFLLSENVKLDRKDSSSPRMTEQVQNLLRRLECISRDLKVLGISYSVFSM